ncbi:MAG TPA: peptide chain release factor N(5)-glutamine methyltransferase [Chloroflexota bacterium]
MLSVERRIPSSLSSPEPSIKVAVDDATQRLAGTATGTPRLDAEVLMGHILGWPRARLFAHWDEPLPRDDRHRYHQVVERRAAGEPVAYIRRIKEFLGMELYVDPRVLIPRPETELLVARSVAWLRDRPGARVVDVGTGSGAVAMGILKACPDVRLTATDVSPDALDVARVNAERQAVSFDLASGSLLEPVDGPIDLVVANLPYLSRDEYESLLATPIAFEPRQALTDEADGLRLFDALLAEIPAKLSPAGAVLLEIGSGQPAALQHLARGWHTELFADYAGLPRVLQLHA